MTFITWDILYLPLNHIVYLLTSQFCYFTQFKAFQRFTKLRSDFNYELFIWWRMCACVCVCVTTYVLSALISGHMKTGMTQMSATDIGCHCRNGTAFCARTRNITWWQMHCGKQQNSIQHTLTHTRRQRNDVCGDNSNRNAIIKIIFFQFIFKRC